jgi:uncharacterized protein
VDVTPLIAEGRQIIEGYGDGRFRISGEAHAGPVIVFPDRTLSWNLTDPEGLSLEHLEAVFAAEPPVEILLFGCGERMTFVLPSLKAEIRARGPVLEAMDTGAACRTYNVLLTEERRVAAVLIPVGSEDLGK